MSNALKTLGRKLGNYAPAKFAGDTTALVGSIKRGEVKLKQIAFDPHITYSIK